MTIPLNLEGAFDSEQAMRSMIVTRKVCFDHDPYYVQGELRRETQHFLMLSRSRTSRVWSAVCYGRRNSA
jgi:hypothetical protein